MIKIFTSISVCCLILFSGCTREIQKNNPVSIPTGNILWAELGLDSCSVLSIFFTSNGNILAGTNYGLFVSSDSGQSWEGIIGDMSNSSVICFSAYIGEIILAGTASKGIFATSDNGNNWLNIGLQNFNITSLAVSNQGAIFASTRSSGIFVLRSQPDDWEEADTAFSNQTFSSLLVTSDNIIFAGGTGVYRSDDNGKTWSLKNDGLGNWSVYSLIEIKKGNIAAGTDVGGFFISSNNGDTWIQLNSGLDNTELTSLALNDKAHIFAGTWGGGIYRTLNTGLNWAKIDSGLTVNQIYTLTVSSDDYLFAGTFKGIFRTVSKM